MKNGTFRLLIGIVVFSGMNVTRGSVLGPAETVTFTVVVMLRPGVSGSCAEKRMLPVPVVMPDW